MNLVCCYFMNMILSVHLFCLLQTLSFPILFCHIPVEALPVMIRYLLKCSMFVQPLSPMICCCAPASTSMSVVLNASGQRPLLRANKIQLTVARVRISTEAVHEYIHLYMQVIHSAYLLPSRLFRRDHACRQCFLISVDCRSPAINY